MNENTEINTPQPNKGGINPVLTIGIILVIALAGFFIWQSSSSAPGTQDTTLETEEANNLDDAMMSPEQSAGGITAADTSELASGEADLGEDTGSVEVISIEGGSFYYRPNEIRVKKGDTVRIEMTSKDMMHDFVIDELGVKMPVVQAGTTGSVEFVADTVGEFEFYCSVGQHRANGQVGTLIVEE